MEVKRGTDTHIRREVVGQMLDYAANGIQFWPIDEIKTLYENNVNGGESPTLSDIGISPENEDTFWQTVSLNLRNGKVRLLFVADEIPASLQAIIEYLNEQMRDTEVFGLEIKQYLSTDGLTTLVPHLIGRTASAVRVKSGDSRKWDEESFITQMAELFGDDNADLCRKLLRAFEAIGCYIWWGEGKDRGAFVPVYIGKQRHQLCSIYNAYKRSLVEIYFRHVKSPFTEPEYRQKLKAAIERIPGVSVPDDRIEKRPSFDIDLLSDENSFNLFIAAMRSYVDYIKADEVNIMV